MIFLHLLEPLGIDYTVYWEASFMFLHRLNPYLGIFSSSFPYNYPPPSFFFIWWLGLFSKTAGAPVWNFLSLGAVLISILLLVRLVQKKVNKALFLCLCLLFTLPFFPVKFNIGNGQINHFIFLFCVLSIFLYQKNHKNFSAAFLAYAIGIKFAPAIFIFYFLIKKDYQQILRTILMAGMIFALSFLIVPMSQQIQYYFHVLPLSFTLGAKDWYYNQSLEGFLARSFHFPVLILGSTYFLTLIILFLTWLKGRKIGHWRLWAAVSSLYLIVHPIALQHYFAFSIIPLLFLGFDLIKNRGSKWLWFLLVICYFLIAKDIRGFENIPSQFNFILSHQFYGILSLWIFALFREKSWRIIGVLWISAITLGYISTSLCHAKICF